VALLKCLSCGNAPLAADSAGFRCESCGRKYPVVREVARFVDRSGYAGSFGFQWTRFARVQLDSASGTTRSRDTFVTKTGWSTADLRGERILDAGCGMGRFTEVCAEAGAEVHAIDLSEAVEVAAQNLGDRENAHFYQADIFGLPFKDGSFEFIPIPEGRVRDSARADFERTYGNTLGRFGRPFIDYFPPGMRERMFDQVMHVDPEFDTFTYGDRPAPLRFCFSGSQETHSHIEASLRWPSE